MNTSIELYAELLAVSGCLWLLLFIYVSMRIQRFIIKRYERETKLLDTVYFKEHATFTKLLPGFISSSIYITHLLSFVWLWNYCKKKKPYRDIKESVEVIQLFAKKEIRRVKLYAISGCILIVHGIIFIYFELVWPEVFS